MANGDEIILKMFIQPGNDKLREIYENAVKTHNAGLYNPFTSAGFDFSFVGLNECTSHLSNSRRTLHLQINCAMYAYRPYTPQPSWGRKYVYWSGFSHHTNPDGTLDKDKTTIEIPQAFTVYQNRVAHNLPHIELKQTNTITPTNFKSLGNSNIGIIDAGYRGELTGIKDDTMTLWVNHYKDEWGGHSSPVYNFKICHPSLSAFKVVIVDTIEELGNTVKTDIPKDSDNFGLDTLKV